MISVSVQVDQASLAAFSAQMDARAKLIGRAQRDTVGFAAGYLVKSLKAGTANAPKVRKIVKNPSFIEGAVMGRDASLITDKANKMRAHAVEWYKTHGAPAKPTGRKNAAITMGNQTRKEWMRITTPFAAVKSRFSGERELRLLYGAKSRSDAKQHRGAMIGRSGLADRSWGWLLRSLGKQQSGRDGGILSKATDSSLVFNSGSTTEATWTGKNRLKYIRAALKRSIGASMEAAANRMRKDTERLVAKEVAGGR